MKIFAVLIGSLVGLAPALAADHILGPSLSREVDKTLHLDNGVLSLGFLNSTCTGAQISKAGHVLVNRHCVESLAAWPRPDGLRFVGAQQLFAEPEVKAFSYDIALLAEKLHFHVGLDEGVERAILTAIGPGNLWPRFGDELPPPAKDLHEKWSDNGFSSGGDFAVVLIPALEGRRCLKFAKTRLREGDPLSSISYPCVYRADAWPQLRSSEMLLDAAESGRQAGEFFRVAKGNFLMGHPAESCNSGSPVMNSANEIAGVLHTALDLEDGNGLSIAIHVERILELIGTPAKELLVRLNEECGG